MKNSNNNTGSTYVRALNGFEIREFTNWQSRPKHWQFSDKGKKYIIFRFTDDKKLFQREHPDKIKRRITITRAIPMLQKNGVSDEEIAQIGNFPKWWNESFTKAGGAS